MAPQPSTTTRSGHDLASFLPPWIRLAVLVPRSRISLVDCVGVLVCQGCRAMEKDAVSLAPLGIRAQ